MIRYKFILFHINFWRTNTDIHTTFVKFLFSFSLFWYWMRQLLRTWLFCKWVPTNFFWTHHVIHEINTLVFSFDFKTQYFSHLFAIFIDSLTVVCCIWRKWRHWLWDCWATSRSSCRWCSSRGWDGGRDIVSSTSCSGVGSSYAISTINFSSFFGQSREKLVGALVGWL